MRPPRALGPDILALQLLIVRPCRPALVLPVLADVVPLLPRVARGQPVVAPVAHELQPANRVALVVRHKGAVAGRVHCRRVVPELVDVGRERRVPGCAAVAPVHQHAKRQVPVWDRVRVRAGRRVVCVRAERRIREGPAAVGVLLDYRVGQGFARRVLRVPERHRLAVLEPDHVMFPVADVVAELLVEDDLALVVGVEVAVEGVDDVGAFVVDDDAAGHGAVGLSVGVRSDAFQPGRVFGEVVVRGQIDILGTVVQGFEVFQCQGGSDTRYRFAVLYRVRVCQLCRDIRRQVLFSRVQPDYGS